MSWFCRRERYKSTSHPAGGGMLQNLWNQTYLSVLDVDLTVQICACQKAAHKTHPVAFNSDSKNIMNLHHSSFGPRIKFTVILPLNNPNTARHDRTSKWACEILSRFSSKSSEHSLNATRSSCFSSVSKYPISLVKKTQEKSHAGKDFVPRATFYHWQKDWVLQDHTSKYYSLNFGHIWR